MSLYGLTPCPTQYPVLTHISKSKGWPVQKLKASLIRRPARRRRRILVIPCRSYGFPYQPLPYLSLAQRGSDDAASAQARRGGVTKGA